MVLTLDAKSSTLKPRTSSAAQLCDVMRGARSAAIIGVRHERCQRPASRGRRPKDRRSRARSTGPRRATPGCSCGRSARRAARRTAPSCSCTAPRWRRSRPSTCTCRAGRTRRRWNISPSAASTPGRSTWRATAAPPRTAASTPPSPRAPTTLRPAPTTSSRPATHRPASGLWHLVGRVARGAVRAAPSEPGAAARARRPCLDRRRQPDAGRAAQEAAGVSQDQAPADRPRFRALDLRARPSRHRRRQVDRGVRRRHPGARRLDPERHLHRHVQQPAGGRSDPDQGADHRHARRIRRHCRASRTC